MNKEELLKQFGKNVKIERIKKDLSQEKLSNIMNVNQNYISSIENGKENMSLGKILELSQYINTDINNLLDFKYQK